MQDNVTLKVRYSTADVMVVPSKQEAFGQTATKAIACSTSVVAFGSTGLLDIFNHKENDYLVKPFETEDLVNCIEWIIENKIILELKLSQCLTIK